MKKFNDTTKVSFTWHNTLYFNKSFSLSANNLFRIVRVNTCSKKFTVFAQQIYTVLKNQFEMIC